MAAIKHIKELSEMKALQDECKDRLIIMDFYADWCGPCRLIAPKYEDLANKNSDVTFVKINVDDADELTEQYHISVMPTFILEWNGTILETITGASEHKITDAIQKHRNGPK